MLDFEQIFEKYRAKNLSPLAQDSTDKIKAVKKTVLDFENFLRENVGGFDDAGRKNFEDALQDTTLEILDEIKTADDSKNAVIKVFNCFIKKSGNVETKITVLSAMVDYIYSNNLN